MGDWSSVPAPAFVARPELAWQKNSALSFVFRHPEAIHTASRESVWQAGALAALTASGCWYCPSPPLWLLWAPKAAHVLPSGPCVAHATPRSCACPACPILLKACAPAATQLSRHVSVLPAATRVAPSCESIRLKQKPAQMTCGSGLERGGPAGAGRLNAHRDQLVSEGPVGHCVARRPPEGADRRAQERSRD